MNDQTPIKGTRSLRAEASEDIGRNPTANPTIGDVIAARFNRRDILRGGLGVTAIAATVSPLALIAAGRARAASAGSFDFTELKHGVDTTHHVADGYDADILIRWGDPIFPDGPAFDPANQTAAAQRRQFGYNNDYIGLVPQPDAPDDLNRRLLVVHHEYTNEELMFPGVGIQDGDAKFSGMTKELVDIEIAAHGGTVLEVARDANGKWRPVIDSKYNRRIDAMTPMHVSGPVAGHKRIRTSADPEGKTILGTFNNCAGGLTPWNTWLMSEENFHGYFLNKPAEGAPEAKNHARYGVGAAWYDWGSHYDRFDVAKEPNEANRFGWIVEVDPADPTSTPVKRTALGRGKHEGANTVVNKDGRVVAVMGDDERFEYIYRFVTDGTWDPANPNRDLLDEGTLSVARFNADGTLDWLPIVHGSGPLTAENGFESQADVLIETRRAADLLGATKMDRPEDVEFNAKTGRIYAMLTNNTKRKVGDEDAANPRADNAFGHIMEMIAPDMDFAADQMQWEILVKCGDPSIAEVGATFSSATTEDGWFGMPDNCAVDPAGRLWISTDGNKPNKTGRTDGFWSMETEGELRGTSKLFFRCPVGAEMCGPMFTPDSQALFLAVQHPADDGEDWPEFGRVSTFDDPSTRWPDFKEGVPPRPSVVVVTKRGGGKIA
jgi:secreted PhoX family phosphatase